MCGCKGVLKDDSPCPRDVVDGEEWCIFHHPKPNLEFSNIFHAEFLQEAKRQYREHNDHLDFTGFVFPCKMRFDLILEPPKIGGEIPHSTFKDCVFDRDAHFSFRDFNLSRAITFHNGVDFEKAIFRDGAFFENVVFEKTARFYKTEFQMPIYFSESIFK